MPRSKTMELKKLYDILEMLSTFEKEGYVPDLGKVELYGFWGYRIRKKDCQKVERELRKSGVSLSDMISRVVIEINAGKNLWVFGKGEAIY